MWQYKVAVLKAGLMNWKWDDDPLADLSIEEGLNRLGRQGWELVAAPTYELGGTTGEITFIFKKSG